MRSGTSRDGRQQSRVIRGNDRGFDICTVDHANNGAVRVDATIAYTDCNHEVGVYTHQDIERLGDKFFKVYAPCAGDAFHPPDENVRFLKNLSSLSLSLMYFSCNRSKTLRLVNIYNIY
jgi:DUF971 family protein